MRHSELLSILTDWDKAAKMDDILKFNLDGRPAEVQKHEENYSIEYMDEPIDDEGYGGENNPMYHFDTVQGMAKFVRVIE